MSIIVKLIAVAAAGALMYFVFVKNKRSDEEPIDLSHTSQTQPEYDLFGYDKYGRDAGGYDAEGYDINGYDVYGYDRNGQDIYGNNKQY